VQQHVRALPSRDDEALGVGMLGCLAEGALLPQRLRARLDVRHPMRRPQALELVRHAGQQAAVLDGVAGARLRGGHARSSADITRAGAAMAARMRSIAASTGTPFSCEPSRNRNDTVPAARSCSPAMRMSGTFAV